MSQQEHDDRYSPSTAFETYNGVDARTEQLEKELAELEAARDAALNPPEPEEEVDEFEEAYSEVDIRAHDAKAAAANTKWAQKRFNEAKAAREEAERLREQLKEAQRQLDEATRLQPTIPTEEWAQENPESAAQVEARIHNNNLVVNEEIEALRAEIKALRAEKESDEAAQIEMAAADALRARVPEADDLISSPEFNQWLEGRPAFKQVMEGTLDVESAASVLQTYKFELAAENPSQLKQKAQQADIEAAAGAIKSASNEVQTKKEPKIWRESEISAMSLQEYKKYEHEIDVAFAEGRYDPTS